MNKQILLSLVFLLGLSTQSHAQTDGPPKEAPYVDELNEFDEAIPDDSKKDAGSRLEDEMNSVQSEEPPMPEIPVETEAPAVVEEEPAVVPSYEPEPAMKRVQTPRRQIERQNAKGGVEYIEHPLAAKGLVKIEKDGTYIYKTTTKLKEKETHASGTVRFGTIDPPNIKSSDGYTDFKMMYTSSSVPIVMFDYEWQPWETLGKFSVVGGFGFMTATGQGHFVSDGTEAQEKYTFIAFPLNLGVSYRFEYFNRQWLAPYLAGGAAYVPVAEIRDDNKGPNATGAPGAYGAGGIMFNIGALDRETAFNLSAEYDIKNLWVTAEFRYLKTFNDAIDFSSSIINVGVTVDY